MKAAAPFVLAALVLLQAGAFIANSSGTYDETVYLHMAEGALENRDNAEFPAKGVAPLPIVLAYALPVLNHVTDYVPAILLARATAVAFVAVPLILVVYFWMMSQFDARAGLLAASLVALSPNIVAHGSIATTDACFVLFALATLWMTVRYVDRPTWSRLAALVAAGAAVFAAKYSGIVLSAVTGVMLVWMDRPARSWMSRLGSAAAVVAAMTAAGFAVTWNYHPIEGLTSQLFHQRTGHEAFLFGRRSTTGWWYYQLVAVAVKSTYVELVSFAIAIIAFAAALRDRSVFMRSCGITFVVILTLSMLSRVSIGVRYVLVLTPLAIMASTAWLDRVTSSRRYIGQGIAVVAIVAQGVSAFSAAPRYLSYFNGIAGGPMNGYRLLADSNLDWGQDLPAMRQVLASVGAREPVAAYFGSAPPDAYGVNVWLWDVAGPHVKRRADWIVISATYLDGVYTVNDTFAPFRAIEPTARPTPTLFVYDTRRPEVKAAIDAAIARKP